MIGLRYLVDTDVLIWHLRGHEPTEAVLRRVSRDQPLACSVLSVFEVWSGVRRQEEKATRAFLDTLQQVEVDAAIAVTAAGYWRDFRRRGVTLGRADALVAATAHVHDLVLVTYNRSHYPMDDVSRYAPMPAL